MHSNRPQPAGRDSRAQRTAGNPPSASCGGQRPDSSPRAGQRPPSSSSRASNSQYVRGCRPACSSTAPLRALGGDTPSGAGAAGRPCGAAARPQRRLAAPPLLQWLPAPPAPTPVLQEAANGCCAAPGGVPPQKPASAPATAALWCAEALPAPPRPGALPRCGAQRLGPKRSSKPPEPKCGDADRCGERCGDIAWSKQPGAGGDSAGCWQWRLPRSSSAPKPQSKSKPQPSPSAGSGPAPGQSKAPPNRSSSALPARALPALVTTPNGAGKARLLASPLALLPLLAADAPGAG